MVVLTQFISKYTQRALPFFKLLKKGTMFEWRVECEKAFCELKEAISSPRILTRQDAGKTLYLYLAVVEEAISATLVRENTEGQKPVYFISKALQGLELRYQRVKKMVLALIIVARRLRPNFLSHQIVVRIDQPLR